MFRRILETLPKSGNVWRNAIMATCQVIVAGGVLFFLYRYLLNKLGSENVGIWAVVLSTASASRISELGLSGGTIKFVAAANARGDFRKSADIVQTASITIGIILAIVLIAGYPIIGLILSHIVPAVSLSRALELLPYALASIWLGGTGGVIHSSLDGCQRADLRAVVSMVAVVLYLLLVFMLVPMYGLIGLGMAQICQALFIMAVSWTFLKRQISALPLVPFRWRFNVFREMFSYSVNFQVISIFSMLYEPLTKAFLTKLGGLSATAYFEMANRMVTQFRALVVSANQVLVPKMAAVHETAPEKISQFYRDTYRIVFFLVVPLFALLIAATPLIGFVWIGYKQPDFIFFGVVVSLGYLINILSGPAYFMNLGIGALRWNVLSHIVLGLATACLGYVFGIIWGSRGVVIGFVIALVLASAIIVLGTYKDQKFSFHDLIPGESRWLISGSFTAIILVYFVNTVVIDGISSVLHYLIGLIAAILILMPAVWCHPVRAIIWTRLANIHAQSSERNA